MSNPNFLSDDYGVPSEIAKELLEWAKQQEVIISPNVKFPENERAYKRAALLIKRVKSLGYIHRKDRAA